MLRFLALISLLTTAALNAQSANPASAGDPTLSTQPAPIVRAYQSNPAPQPNQTPQANPDSPTYPSDNRAPIVRRSRRLDLNRSQLIDSQPISGVWLRSTAATSLKTISATPQTTEILLERGILNVSVHHPSDHAEILIDLPGGQTSLLKDGLYTFNADTNTVRVLHGEAAAFPASASGTTNNANATAGKPVKAIKIKEAHQLSFTSTSGGLMSFEAYPFELTADLLPIDNGDSRTYANYSDEYAPYGYPYYAGALGYPYSYGYPYGFYPYSIGFGYFGGFHGGYRGGFHR